VLPERGRLPQLPPEPAQQAHGRLVGHGRDVRGSRAPLAARYSVRSSSDSTLSSSVAPSLSSARL
jgi:hypothetical protein